MVIIESYEDWIRILVDDEVFFIGHSTNCNDIAELLRTLGHETELKVMGYNGNIDDIEDFRQYVDGQDGSSYYTV